MKIHYGKKMQRKSDEWKDKMKEKKRKKAKLNIIGEFINTSHSTAWYSLF